MIKTNALAYLRPAQPEMRVREPGQICDLAGQHGPKLGERIEMSVNNPSLVSPTPNDLS